MLHLTATLGRKQESVNTNLTVSDWPIASSRGFLSARDFKLAVYGVNNMNLYIRLLFIFFSARRRNRITTTNLVNEITTIVLPNDLDLNLHVNNGRYMTLCDFNRVDLFIRSGLAGLMVKNKWAPIVAEHTMTYIKPLSIFDKIRVSMEITHWDEKYFYSNHCFYKKDTKVAEGTSKSLIISRKDGSLQPEYVVEQVESFQKNNSN